MPGARRPSGHLAAEPVGSDPRRDRARRLLAALSEREREVALALGRGRTSAELFMSVATAKAYVSPPAEIDSMSAT